MSPFELTFSQMILHTDTSKLMYNWSFLFEVLHKPTLLPSTFKRVSKSRFENTNRNANIIAFIIVHDVVYIYTCIYVYQNDIYRM